LPFRAPRQSLLLSSESVPPFMKKGYSRLPSDVKKLKKAAKEAVRPGHRCRRPINRLKDDRPPVHLEIAGLKNIPLPARPPSRQRFAVLHDVSSSYMKLLSQDEAAESGRPARRPATAAASRPQTRASSLNASKRGSSLPTPRSGSRISSPPGRLSPLCRRNRRHRRQATSPAPRSNCLILLKKRKSCPEAVVKKDRHVRIIVVCFSQQPLDVKTPDAHHFSDGLLTAPASEDRRGGGRAPCEAGKNRPSQKARSRQPSSLPLKRAGG